MHFKNLIHFLIKDIFLVSFLAFILFALIENFFPGFIVFYFDFKWFLYVNVLAGLCLVIFSACVKHQKNE